MTDNTLIGSHDYSKKNADRDWLQCYTKSCANNAEYK